MDAIGAKLACVEEVEVLPLPPTWVDMAATLRPVDCVEAEAVGVGRVEMEALAVAVLVCAEEVEVGTKGALPLCCCCWEGVEAGSTSLLEPLLTKGV